jgi:hypothetical protein
MKHTKKDQDEQELEALGQESEKEALKDVPKIFKAKNLQAKETEHKLEELLKKPKTIKTYNSLLANLLQTALNASTYPKGWTFKATSTEKGVILNAHYKSTNQNVSARHFTAAFTPTHDKKLDLNAIKTLLIRTENTIDTIIGT